MAGRSPSPPACCVAQHAGTTLADWPEDELFSNQTLFVPRPRREINGVSGARR